MSSKLGELVRSIASNPPFGKALAITGEIKDLQPNTLSEMIQEELGFTRETKMFNKKIDAATNPKKYFDERQKRQGELIDTIASFVQAYAKSLRDAGFTPEETGIIARHVVRVLGDIVKIQLEAEYPTEFVRKGLEDLLKRKYR